MSDEFDREAEREKLREKYEQDQAKREASERMSELLLQGATMTNRHCPECHSPVFSYEGTEFCPTCQREVTEEGELAGDADGTRGEGTAGGVGANGETGASTDAGTPPADGGTEPAEEPEPTEGSRASGPRAEPEPEPEPESRPADATAEAAGDAREPEPRQPREETRPAPARERRPARVDPPARREEPTADRAGADREGLDDAEAALVREITNLTRRAEETRDVGRKRDFFAAAREAAETLETVRRL